MAVTTIGKLREKLVIESELDGEPSIVVFPKGAIVEISSDDEYPHTISDKDMKEAVEYLKDYK